jgi:hypothetical protein
MTVKKVPPVKKAPPVKTQLPDVSSDTPMPPVKTPVESDEMFSDGVAVTSIDNGKKFIVSKKYYEDNESRLELA